MGIRGLMKHLQRIGYCGKSIDVNGPPPTLLIDGNGFLYHILDIVEEKQNSLRFYGGDYVTFHAAIESEIRTAILSHFRVQVFFDGLSRSKSQTKLLRHEKKQREWDNLFHFCHGSLPASNEFPVPPCYKMQMIASLTALGIDFIHCDGEADQELAKACASKNMGCTRGEECCFIYGNDS